MKQPAEEKGLSRSCSMSLGGLSLLLGRVDHQEVDFDHRSLDRIASVLLDEVGLSHANPALTPMALGTVMRLGEAPRTASAQLEVVADVNKAFNTRYVHYSEIVTFYSHLVSSIGWIASKVGPILLLPHSILCRMLSAPTTAAFTALKRVLRYLAPHCGAGSQRKNLCCVARRTQCKSSVMSSAFESLWKRRPKLGDPPREAIQKALDNNHGEPSCVNLWDLTGAVSHPQVTVVLLPANYVNGLTLVAPGTSTAAMFRNNPRLCVWTVRRNPYSRSAGLFLHLV